jgi:hypothetical protein
MTRVQQQTLTGVGPLSSIEASSATRSLLRCGDCAAAMECLCLAQSFALMYTSFAVFRALSAEAPPADSYP